MRPFLLALSLAFFALFTFVPVPASAEDAPTTTTAAPPISFCINDSFTCVTPDFYTKFANYDLRDKKWVAGVSEIGVGYSLLFFSDQPYASGVALHGAFDLSQITPSYLSLVPTVVIAKYFEVGVNITFLDGDIKYYLTAGVAGNFEGLTSLVTGKNLGERYRVLKLEYQARQAAAASATAPELAPAK